MDWHLGDAPNGFDSFMIGHKGTEKPQFSLLEVPQGYLRFSCMWTILTGSREQ